MSTSKTTIPGIMLFGTAACLLASLATFAGCNSGARSSNGTLIPGVSQAAPPLEFDNMSYVGPNLETLRYGHTGTTLERGQVLVVGGTDEGFLTSLDSVEIFDQTLTADPVPQSLSGDWITTDLNGDPILLINGGRLSHTSTLLPNGNVLIAGGTADHLIAEAYPEAEIFDVQARQFNTDAVMPMTEMIEPRFRHTANLLANGKVLIAGGQLSLMVTIIDPNEPPGSPFFQFDITVFPSTKSIEAYNPASRSFETVEDLSGTDAELQTTRGRADHTSVIIAGLDNRLDTADDVVLIAAGYQTPSPLFAPILKFPGQPDLQLQQPLEYYDLETGLVNIAPGVTINPGRTNGAHMANLGFYNSGQIPAKTNPTDPDADPCFLDAQLDEMKVGTNNIAILFGGDDNAGACATSVGQTDSIVCTFTGFGIGNGIQFLQLTPPPGGIEAIAVDPMNCFPVGRVYGTAISIPTRRRIRCNDEDSARFGTTFLEYNTTNVLQIGGMAVVNAPGCPRSLERWGPVCPLANVRGVEVFDPNFSLTADATVPWDLNPTEIDPLHPTGVTGTWLLADDMFSDGDPLGDLVVDFAEASNVSSILRAPRLLHSSNRVPGEDGILGTGDDRILIVGGAGDFYGDAIFGEEAVSIGAEIYLPPFANGLPTP